MKTLKVISTISLLGVFCLIFTTLVLADYKGNPRKGRYLYRKNCLSCHAIKAQVQGAGKVVQPSSKTQEQWKATFRNSNYKKLKCIGQWEVLSDNDIKDLYLFLSDHASDSPTPLTCSGG